MSAGPPLRVSRRLGSADDLLAEFHDYETFRTWYRAAMNNDPNAHFTWNDIRENNVHWIQRGDYLFERRFERSGQ